MSSQDNAADKGPEAAEQERLWLAAVAEAHDRAAFKALFERFAGRVKGFLMKGGATGDQAEELVQEVMITVWRKAGQFDASKASVSTWIFTIARNRRIDALRRQARPEPDAADPAFQPEPQADAQAEISSASRDARVRQALEALSDDQRRVVSMAFFAGLSHNEIAEQLGAPLGTVKSRLRLAFLRLKDALGNAFAEELVDD